MVERPFAKTQLHKDFISIITGALEQSAIPKGTYARWLGISHPGLLMVLKGRTGVSFERADLMGRSLGLRLRMRADTD